MALRFGDQGGGLASGLLLAAQTAFVGTLVTGTGNFNVALTASQTGQGEIAEVQVVTGTGSHGVTLAVSQEGDGRLPQVVVNTGSTISWVGPSITVAQEGEGGSEVEPPQAVAGTGAFSIALDTGQSGSGDVTIPPQHATGTGDHGVALAVSQSGDGESVVPAQTVMGGGAFTLTLAVGQSGEGESEVPEQQSATGSGAFGAALGVTQTGSGTVEGPAQQVTGTGQHGVSIAASQAGLGSISQVVVGEGAFSVGIAASMSGHGSTTFRSVIGIRATVRQISMDLAECVSLRYVAGNSIDLEFTATRDGEPAPIGGVIARFVLSKNGTPAVSTEDSDHSAVATLTDAGSGIFTVTVAAQYTQALLGTYQFQAELEDALGGIATVSRGFITFDRNLLLVA